MQVLRLISFGLVLITTCLVNAVAQEPNLSKPAGTENTPVAASSALPEFVVEVNRPGGCVAAPVSPKHKVGYLLYSLPRPAKILPDKAGSPITSKVSVSARQDGEQWHVKVVIGTGEFFDAGDFMVGDFKLNPNQRVTVTEVSKFGLAPIRVGVMKIIRGQAAKPQFTNLTQSVVLQSMEVMSLPDPFKLTLQNKSDQDLIALQYNVFGPRGFLGLKWLSPGLLTPLIKNGQNYALKVNSEDNSCSDEEGYRPNQTHRIDLVSAIFADGTYQGEPALPALIKGTALGNKRNLLNVVQTIGHITDATQLSQQLNNLQEGMNEEADFTLVETLRSMFPMLTADSTPALTNYIRSGMHEVKVNLKRDAQRLDIIIKRNNSELIERWIKGIRQKYEHWFAAAEKITSQ